MVRSSYRRGILAQLLGRGFLVRQQLGRIILGSSCAILTQLLGRGFLVRQQLGRLMWAAAAAVGLEAGQQAKFLIFAVMGCWRSCCA